MYHADWQKIEDNVDARAKSKRPTNHKRALPHHALLASLLAKLRPPRRGARTMCGVADTLSGALPHVRGHTTWPPARIYRHVAELLTQYSSGLSLPITLDSLTEPTPPPPAFLEATVVSTHDDPTIHHLRCGGTHLALFPCSTLPPLPRSTTLLLPRPPPSPDALSLARRVFPPVHHALLPGRSLAIRLPFPVGLPRSHNAYSLFSTWRNRDLTPPAVYATLVHAARHPAALTLVDRPDSPAVVLTLSHPARELARMLPVPCALLVTHPLVTPFDNSFRLQHTPQSTFFYQPLPNHRKRNRPSPDESDTLYAAPDLVELQRTPHQHPIMLHTRVEEVQKSGGGSVVSCQQVSIALPGSDYELGDELLLDSVTFAKRWSAGKVTNISTMPGVLHCPFIRKLVSITQATTLCRGAHTTAHLRVVVENAMRQPEFVRLSVVDVEKGHKGSALMKERGFQQLFAVSKDCFAGLGDDVVIEKVQRLRGLVWLMTVTCGAADHPVLTACLRGS